MPYISLTIQSIENLTLTWKVDEGIFQHIDIKERDKPNKFSLGRSLLIGNEVMLF